MAVAASHIVPTITEWFLTRTCARRIKRRLLFSILQFFPRSCLPNFHSFFSGSWHRAIDFFAGADQGRHLIGFFYACQKVSRIRARAQQLVSQCAEMQNSTYVRKNRLVLCRALLQEIGKVWLLAY